MQQTRTRTPKKPVKTHPWDVAEYLEEPEDVAAYLEAAFEDGDAQLIVAALGDVTRARGMTKVASATGLGRESLYKALSGDGNPRFATVLKVLQSLGIHLFPSAVSRAHPPGPGPEADWDEGFKLPTGGLFVYTSRFEEISVACASDCGS